jgi:hypothetical protein
MSKKGKGSKKAKKEEGRPQTPLGTALVAEQDRGCILVGCAYLEHGLELLLDYYLKDETQKRPWGDPGDAGLIGKILNPRDPSALLGSGWSKSLVSYLFGLIDRFTFEGFDKIRKMRVECAHRPGEVILDDALLSELMNATETYGKSEHDEINRAAEIYLAGGKNDLWSELAGPNRFSASRVKFMHACVLVDARIIFKVMRYSAPNIDTYFLGLHHSDPGVVLGMQRYTDPTIPSQLQVFSPHVSRPSKENK